MSRRFEDRIALVTGAGRGLGRSHAVRLAEEGAAVIAIDVCANLPNVSYDLSSSDDLAETVRMVEEHGSKAVACAVDVCDSGALTEEIDRAVALVGGLDFVSVNAGVVGDAGTIAETPDSVWNKVIGVNLTGAFNTARAVIPHLQSRGSGSIVFTASVASAQGMRNLGSYVASKHGVMGLMRTLAIELGADGIRVNAVLPTTIRTPMSENFARLREAREALDEPSADDPPAQPAAHLLPVTYVEPEDVTNALLWLFSDEARMVTGVGLPVDAGALIAK